MAVHWMAGVVSVNRGLDGNELCRILFEAGGLGVIDTRNLWQDINLHPDQFRLESQVRAVAQKTQMLQDRNGAGRALTGRVGTNTTY